MAVTVQSITPGDSAFLLVEHNWAPPDSFKTPNPNYKLSPYHYWKVSGILPNLFDATGSITYDGRTSSTSGGACWLDQQLLTNSNQEDSIVLLYRKNAADDWGLFPYYTKTKGNLTDKYGTIKIDSLLLGEYSPAFAYTLSNGMAENKNENSVIVYPNPFSKSATLTVKGSGLKVQHWELKIYDVLGNCVHRQALNAQSSPLNLDIPAGIYFYKLESSGEIIATGKIVTW
jgi:hypothetical protein